MFRKFTFFILLAVFFGFGDALSQTKEDPVWIDVRSWLEYQAEHIPGDLRISHEDIVQKLAEQGVSKDTPIYVYCASGGRAQVAVEKLQNVGYQNAINRGSIAKVKAFRFGEAQ